MPESTHFKLEPSERESAKHGSSTDGPVGSPANGGSPEGSAGPADTSLQALLSRPDIWRGRATGAGAGWSATIASSNSSEPSTSRGCSEGSGVDTGYPPLNDVLVAAGWPLGGLVEIQSDDVGYGEWQLLLPALSALSGRANNRSRRIVLLAPPHIPYAPAIAQAGVSLEQLLVIQPPDQQGLLWAAEQVLRSGTSAALLLWDPSLVPSSNRGPRGRQRSLDYPVLRRLQLAASGSRCLFFLLQTSGAIQRHSPAVLRLKLLPAADCLLLAVLKQRGSHGRCTVRLPIPACWREYPSLSQMPAVNPHGQDSGQVASQDTDQVAGTSSFSHFTHVPA